RGADLSPLCYQPTDVLSLVAPLRSARSRQPGRSFAPPAALSSTDLDVGAGGARGAPAAAISPLGQRQAGRPAPQRWAAHFHFDGRSHPRPPETARRVARTTPFRRRGRSAAAVTPSSLGHSQAQTLAHRAARRSGRTRHQGTATDPGAG